MTPLDKITADIIDIEAQVENHTRTLATQYLALMQQFDSARKAANHAKRHGLKYADNGSMTRLVHWGELVDYIESFQEGDDLGHHPSEKMIRPLLTGHVWDAAGAAALAELWLQEDWPSIGAYVTAAKGKWRKGNEGNEGNKKTSSQRDAIAALHALGSAQYAAESYVTYRTGRGQRHKLNKTELYSLLALADYVGGLDQLIDALRAAREDLDNLEAVELPADVMRAIARN